MAANACYRSVYNDLIEVNKSHKLDKNGALLKGGKINGTKRVRMGSMTVKGLFFDAKRFKKLLPVQFTDGNRSALQQES